MPAGALEGVIVTDKDKDAKNENKDTEPFADYSEWKQEYENGAVEPRESFRRVSNIALCVSYDLLDKLRWYEKETMKLPDEEIEERLPHMVAFLDLLGTAYDEFSDVDI
jgi:hypothetical protein